MHRCEMIRILLLSSCLLGAFGAKQIDRHCLDCMCQASSGCKLNIRCHNAADGGYFCGPYQISWAYWADAGKPGSRGFSNDFEKCLTDRSCAERTIAGYMSKYANDCNGDGVIDCRDFAAIHKTGPTSTCNQSWLKNSKYWRDFDRCYASSPSVVPGSIVSEEVTIVSEDRPSGITGSANFPSHNRNHDDPRPLRGSSVAQPPATASGVIASTPSRSANLESSSISSLPNVSSDAALGTRIPNVATFTASRNGGEHTTTHHYSSSSSFSNYTEITEEYSATLPSTGTHHTSSNIGFTSGPSRSALPGGAVYESHRSSSVSHSVPVNAVDVEEAPAVDNIRPISHQYLPNPTPAPVQPIVQPQPQPQPLPARIQESIVPESCLNCLCQASSKCNLKLGCDGAYCGPYLLSWAYWTDGGKPGSPLLDYPTCSNNLTCAEQAVNGYMTKWTRDCNGDGVVDCTDFALIHKLGPHGCHKLEALKSTEYWNRFEACYAPLPSSVSAPVPAEPAVEVRQPEAPLVAPQPVSNYQPKPVVVEAPRVSEQPRFDSQPVGRRNDFIEQPLNINRPQPGRSSSRGATSNIRISFGNREIVNTAVSDAAIIHPNPPSPFVPPQPQPARQPVNNYNPIPAQPTRVQDFSPRSSSPAFANDVVSQPPRAADYISNPNQGFSVGGSNIREVPANMDNTGFDDNTFSGRSVDSTPSPNVNDVVSNSPFSSSNSTSRVVPSEQLVSQECLNCMCHAASRCDANIGCSSDSRGKFVCGVFQVDWQYWSDAGKPGNRADLSNLENFQMCMNDRKCADETIRGYMEVHKMDCNNDGVIDCLDFAALHVVGPQNCRAKWYLESKYYSDFRQCIDF